MEKDDHIVMFSLRFRRLEGFLPYIPVFLYQLRLAAPFQSMEVTMNWDSVMHSALHLMEVHWIPHSGITLEIDFDSSKQLFLLTEPHLLFLFI